MGMSKKQLFMADYAIQASVKMLYPYIQTASGLAEWFADDVKINNYDKAYIFIWDREERRAQLTAQRLNHFVRFTFMADDEADKDDPSYIELRLEFNELTQSVYLKVSDYSDFADARELKVLWDSLIDSLRSIVGG